MCNWAHRIVAIVEQEAGQEPTAQARPFLMVGDAVAVELGLHGIEQFAADNRLVLAGMRYALVDRLSHVHAVAKDVAQRADIPAASADL